MAGSGSGAATAAVVARKGAGLLLSATRSSYSALSRSVSKVRKDHAVKHEKDVLQELRSSGIAPADLVFQALTRIYFLYMAGYKNEVFAAAMEAGKRLVDAHKSRVPLNAVLVFATTLSEVAESYHGSALGGMKSSNLKERVQEFLNKSRNEPHVDRTSLSHDIYYAILHTSEAHGEEWHELERVFRDAATRVVGNAMHASQETKDARAKAAKAMHILASQIQSLAREAQEARRRRSSKAGAERE